VNRRAPRQHLDHRDQHRRARLGFGLDSASGATDRVANHRTSKVTDVYDRHGYADEDKRIMASVARLVVDLVEGTRTTNVVSLR